MITALLGQVSWEQAYVLIWWGVCLTIAVGALTWLYTLWKAGQLATKENNTRSYDLGYQARVVEEYRARAERTQPVVAPGEEK